MLLGWPQKNGAIISRKEAKWWVSDMRPRRDVFAIYFSWVMRIFHLFYLCGSSDLKYHPFPGFLCLHLLRVLLKLDLPQTFPSTFSGTHLLTFDLSVIHFLGRFAKIPEEPSFLCWDSLEFEVSVMRLWIRSNEGKTCRRCVRNGGRGDNNKILWHSWLNSTRSHLHHNSLRIFLVRTKTFLDRLYGKATRLIFPILWLWFEKIPSSITFRSSDLRRKSLWIQSCENGICGERLLWLHWAAGKSLSRL